MFSLMLNKLIHKKWMILCLLIGNMLLIAVAASYPLYRVSSFQRMLQDEFKAYEAEKNEYPSIMKLNYSSMKGGAKLGYLNMEEASKEAITSLNVSVTDSMYIYVLSAQKARPSIVRDNVDEKRITLSAMPGIEGRVELTDGRFPEGTLTRDGFIEVMASEELMIEKDILLGDEYTYESGKFLDGSEIKVRVVGIFKKLNDTDKIWDVAGTAISGNVFTDTALYKDLFLGSDKESQYTMSANWIYLWDYEQIEIQDVSDILYKMERFNMDERFDNRLSQGGAYDILSTYTNKAKRIEATLIILEVPVLLLLSAFLYMIASQMLSMERNEISLFRSRGASKAQVILLYFYQSTFISFLSLIPGIPLGVLFCKLLGSSSAFLEFSAERSLPIKFTGDVLLFAGAAVILSIIITTLPVINFSGLSIVNLKQGRARQKKSFWKRIYLDFILIGISLYGYYSFKRSEDAMVISVLKGESLDPLLYISFSMFILGAGLLAARIQPYIIKAFFAVTKKGLKPATYTSLLSSIRTGAKQEFIILFTILTVSIGISDTTIARTIVANAVNNKKHIVGTEMVLKEKWADNSGEMTRDPSLTLTYTEPEFSKYLAIEGVDTVTQVVYDERASVPAKKLNVTLMGIKASGFYKVTSLDNDLLPYTYEEYLNVLSKDQRAVLLSENFMTKQGYKLGDVITVENANGASMVGKVYGFFTYWPAYANGSYTLNNDGTVDVKDEYMVVANFTELQNKFGTFPYEIWLTTTDHGDGVYKWMQETPNLKLTKFVDMTDEEETIVQDTMFQGTNGILSMSFIVILILCAVGYLIYWIMSIRSRELLFGVLRAMGMRKSEVNWLLIVEQICSGLYAIITGGVVGFISSKLFVPMIQKAYAASEQVLPLELVLNISDMSELFIVIGLVLLICVYVIARIVSKMNISSALKLGED